MLRPSRTIHIYATCCLRHWLEASTVIAVMEMTSWWLAKLLHARGYCIHCQNFSWQSSMAESAFCSFAPRGQALQSSTARMTNTDDQVVMNCHVLWKREIAWTVHKYTKLLASNKTQSQQVFETVHGRTEHIFHAISTQNTFGNQWLMSWHT